MAQRRASILKQPGTLPRFTATTRAMGQRASVVDFGADEYAAYVPGDVVTKPRILSDTSVSTQSVSQAATPENKGVSRKSVSLRRQSVRHSSTYVKAMTSTWEILELADRMGLEGAEFRAWYEERMAREREERAAERKAKKEKLESELRAKMEQLEVERRALERRLEVAMDEKTHLESQSYGQVVRIVRATE
ncbi:hypothetical protein HPB52_005282 [Rhipicephalus sanguineus]|uniref:Uncharacterized protein n=1 Tax=Rhipicephalus sanguineus TaxID=34632 RepID=A0A9D4SXP4_RHISA|nr:hypothetical protein HPB52_005282 [Rhipicephalus sanguineus]